jgi:3-deoxy-D-manno-octulosonate 8-phosphate phosphatase (KDO 8-P phosphatase)
LKKNLSKAFKNFVIDVDGCLTTGQFLYSTRGKVYKIFGPDDNDALSLIKDKINIHFISGDKRGFPITKKRVSEDMGYKLDFVSTLKRIEWIEKKYNLEETIFMGDGIFDILVFKKIGYSIAPSNAFIKTKKAAGYVTLAKGGEGAVAEACLHILENFLEPFDKTLNKFNEAPTD